VVLADADALDESAAVECASLATHAFVTGQLERLRSWFAAPLAEVASLGFLAGVQADLAARHGGFERVAGMPGARRIAGGIVVEIPLVYTNARLKSRITLDAQGMIRGFYVLRSDAP
jgi:hypothetical protein